MAYTDHGFLSPLIKSIQQQDEEFPIVLVEQSSDVAEICAKQEQAGVTVLRPDRNLGVAGGWNLLVRWAFEHNYEAVLLTGDDCFFPDPTSLRTAKDRMLMDTRHIWTILSASCFFITPNVYDKLGEFDEKFWPCFFEDVDYFFRAEEMGVDIRKIDVDAIHHGSKSTRGSSLAWKHFGRNRDYCREKWPNKSF